MEIVPSTPAGAVRFRGFAAPRTLLWEKDGWFLYVSLEAGAAGWWWSRDAEPLWPGAPHGKLHAAVVPLLDAQVEASWRTLGDVRVLRFSSGGARLQVRFGKGGGSFSCNPPEDPSGAPPAGADDLWLAAGPEDAGQSGPAAWRQVRRRALCEAADAPLRRDEARIERRVRHLADEEAAARADLATRAWADWLLVHHAAHLPRRGFRITEAPDGPGGAVPDLDPARTLRENVDLLYGRARRAARRAEEAGRKREASERELLRVREARNALIGMGDPGLFAALRRATAAGSTRTKPPRGRDRTAGIASVQRVELPGGWEARVGRSARANDELVRASRPHDFWFHAADYPGSHVVVPNPRRVPDRELPGEVALAAAVLAAERSQSRDRKVGVHWTQVKFLRKPKGAAAGQVTMARFRSLVVDLDRRRTSGS